jgi:hypothetical protein
MLSAHRRDTFGFEDAGQRHDVFDWFILVYQVNKQINQTQLLVNALGGGVGDERDLAERERAREMHASL